MLEAKSQLSRLVKAALDGEDVVIANHGVPVVRLVRIAPKHPFRKPGAWSSLPKAPDDWDSPSLNAAIGDELTGDDPV
ncbi:MAG TPA: type II toxin-antitoxin system prevent-host-death family antitoxin [Methylococcaceae bacterium]|nr:type II toxin-antitoxin system prevent-host-death family antitoxin [Methylococcaceae bacterium]